MSRRNLNLVLLWIGQFVSATGDAFFSTCVGFLALFLLARHGGPDAGIAVGITRSIDALPFLLFGAYAGVLVDRFSRKKVLLVSDFSRCLILAFVPTLFFAGLLAWWMLPLAAFALYSFSTLFNPARDSLIPRLAEGANLLRVNSLFQTSGQLAMILGATLVGLAIPGAAGEITQTQADRMAWLLAVDAATFFFCFICISFIVVPGAAQTTQIRRESSLHDLLDSLRFALRDARLRALLFLTAVDNFFIMGPAIVGGQFLILHEFKLGPAEYGWFEGTLALGWFLGTILIVRLAPRLKTGHLVLAGMLLDGLTYIPFLWITGYGTALVFIFAHGLSIPLITVGRTTMIQRYYPNERLGRIFSLVAITVQGFTALSAFATGVALGWLNARELFFIAGVFGAACGVLGLVFKSLRQTP